MKKLLLALLITGISSAAAMAATVSGTVTSAATCSVVSGQKVYLVDTFTNGVVDSAVTNTAGFYSITFPVSWTTFVPYLVKANACGATYVSTGAYLGSSTTNNLITCGSAKVLTGNVWLGSAPSTGDAKVYLIKVQRNYPTIGDTTLTAVDSFMLIGSSTYAFRRACAPTDTFLVKAMLLPTNPAYSSWLPSYDSSLTWSTALRYYGSAFNGSLHNLYMFPGTNPGGPGFIGGSVLVGANKTSGVGDPLASRLMILVNAVTSAPVAYTYSDASGKFSFPSVAVGSYQLFGDAAGLYNIPLNVSVTASKLTVNNIVFEENYGENTFKGHFNTTGVNTVGGPLENVVAYPNPATSVVTLQGLNNIKGGKTVVLRNILGSVVLSREFTDGQTVQIAVDGLASGTYILNLTTAVGATSFKVLK